MRKSYLLIGLTFFTTFVSTTLGQTAIEAQSKNFSVKGIRLGMPMEEFKDSMSAINFLEEPDFITDYFGKSQTKPDSLTSTINYYNIDLSLGCKEQYGSEFCAEVEVLTIRFLGGQITEIAMYEFDGFYAENLLEIATVGIEGKLGKPTTDYRDLWEENDIGDGERDVRYIYAEWTHSSGEDTIEAGVYFEKQATDKDRYSKETGKFYPAFDVTISAQLKSKALRKWYDDNMAAQVKAYREERNTPKIKTDF